MAKRKARQGSSEPGARDAILAAALALLRARRGADITTDEVAVKAECAKGLVHYHFKTKDQLLAAAAEQLWRQRTDSWTAALGSVTPKAAIRAAWETLLAEASGGTAAACAALGLRTDELVVRSVSAGRTAFARDVAAALAGLLGRLGLEPSVPVRELGALFVAVVEGIGLQLGSGAAADDMEQAWSAFWAGLLSLTRPGRG
jgi:TetR/AcrR family transcriptional repressor of bet genes